MIQFKGYQASTQLHQSAGSVLYRARRERDGTTVLLKTLRTDYTRIADIARCKHEYDQLQRLNSPYLLPILGVEEHADGLLVVMADFPGSSLASFLAAGGGSVQGSVPALGPGTVSAPGPVFGAGPVPGLVPGRSFDTGQFLTLALLLAAALEDLHHHRLLHGDLRPHNILIAQTPSAPMRIALFGFGVELAVTRENEEVYHPLVLSELLPYISPEQTGRMNRTVDQSTDLYSLGVILYELLAGRPPFQSADPMELIHSHIALVPPALVAQNPQNRQNRQTPAALSAIVNKLLSKNAEERYHSAAGLTADLLECQRRWQSRGDLGELVAGQNDLGDLFKIHQKLYGRTDDIAQLIAAFHEVLAGQRELVLVSGYSGIGKSSLVQEILKPLAREKGYYLSGKYDQYNRDLPYSAILQAFEGLVRQLLSESDARIRRWRDAILTAVSGNGQVLCEFCPALEHLLGKQPAVPELLPLQAQTRFILYFQKFLAVFARSTHPLVLFLDDLQWVDAASLSLLRSILSSGELEALFFCGAYRDNEVSASHPLVALRQEIARSGVIVRNIVLLPLDLPHLIELVGDSLQNPSCAALAEVILKKTGGNPFFVKQFMHSLHEQGVLAFVPGRGWQWDLPKIESLQYTENVVDLMVAAIRRLPAPSQDILKLAAAIGSRFDLETLATISECSAAEAYTLLDRPLQDGLVVQKGEQYHFIHDKVQEAAYSMIAEAERPAFHLRIGRLLRAKLNPADRQGLFDVVNHFHSAAVLISSAPEHLDVAQLSLLAAEKAEESSAFGAALRYLQFGRGHLPADSWAAHYPLTRAYFMKIGLMQSLCGLHDDALATLAIGYAQAHGQLDQVEVRRLVMSVQVLKNDLPVALDEGLAALASFGIVLVPFPDDAALKAELATTMELLTSFLYNALGPDETDRTAEEIIDALVELPPLQGRELTALADILQELFVPCYFLGTNNFGITVMKLLQHSLRHGLSRHTIYAYINFGTFLCAGTDIEKGYLFGRAAVRLNQVQPDKKSEAMLCNMWGAFVQHWKEPYLQSRQTLLRGMHSGVETGQYIWAFYNAVNATTTTLVRGAPLTEVLVDVASCAAMRKLDKFDAITWMIGAVGQLAHNLSHKAAVPDHLKGDWVDIDVIIAEAARIQNRASLFLANVYLVMLGVFQGRFLAAAEIADRTQANVLGTASWLGTPCYYFYAGLSYALAHDEVTAERRVQYRAHATAFAQKLELWATLCSDNLHHRRLLLSAELLRLSGDIAGAGQLYDDAIRSAKSGGFTQDEALASELGARHYARAEKTTIARAYMSEAHKLYARWGATEILARLERDWPQLVPREAERRTTTPTGSLNAALEMNSVLKMTQAISGEIVLARLLGKLLDIILENAGARKGFLILRDETQLRVEAGRDLDSGRPVMLYGAALEGSHDVPISVVQYVARTQEDVVLSEPRREGPFIDDPYIVQHAPQSLLATPILYQGRSAGVIYLENNLAAGAFTPERVEVLRLLTAQAAISLENAMLYAKLEEKVTQRTTELQLAHNQILALNQEQQQRQQQDLTEKMALIQQQQELIQALSTPIIEVWEGVLTVPLIGALDDARAADVAQNLLARIVATRAQFAIIDLTGAEVMDTNTARHLLRIVRAVQLLGARSLITGISPAVAQTMISLDVDLSGVTTHANLREGLKECLTGGAPAARPRR